MVNVLLGELHDMYYFDYCVQQMNTVNGKGIEGNLNRNIKYYVKFCDKNKVIEEEFIQPTFKSIRKGM